ncbi:hypothetical protein BGY98DRAFT_985809 [Russula aff. rugulosa BPL654]|nr:hypothetical protein BGY98DRAFT_985809 [Russula aff. rugulosa BPL654]
MYESCMPTGWSPAGWASEALRLSCRSAHPCSAMHCSTTSTRDTFKGSDLFYYSASIYAYPGRRRRDHCSSI